MGGLTRVTASCHLSQLSSVLEISGTLSKHEAWFNQTVTPNSGFGEFEPNFAAITDS